MQNFSIDYNELQDNLGKKKAYKLSTVKDRIVKIAFDIVRFQDADSLDKLWQIQNQDGEDYIVALYNMDDNDIKVSTAADTSNAQNPWNVLIDKSGSTVNVFYHNTPLTKLSLSAFGIAAEESNLIKSYLPNKLASDDKFRNSFISSLINDEKQLYFSLTK